MYTLHTGTDLEAFLAARPGDFRQDPDQAPSWMIIQSSVMKHWFTNAASRLYGMAFLPVIMTPDNAWRHILGLLGSPADRAQEALFLDDLIVQCYLHLKTIRDTIASKTPEGAELARIYAPVLSWMGYAPSGTGNPSDLVRLHQADQLFTLANECAGLFHSYGANPLVLPGQGDDMLAWWASGRSGFTTRLMEGLPGANGGFARSMEAHEIWQQHLFSCLDIHPRREGRTSGASTLSLRMEDAMSRNLAWQGRAGQKITVFGSTFLSPRAFDFLHWLSSPAGANLEVVHYLFHPAADALAGSQARRWATLGQDLQDHMATLGITPSPRPGTGTAVPDDDLHRVRSLCGGMEEPAVLRGDGSFRLVAGPGMARQTEALYGMIRQALAEDPSLRCSDFLVMAPDIKPWKPFIESVFGPPGGHRDLPEINSLQVPLPWNMSDLSLQGSSDYLAALRGILDLERNRWTREAVFALIENPCFHARHRMDEGDRESFLSFADKAMVRWGLDGSRREAMGGGSSEAQSWNQAFLRFCRNLALDPGMAPADLPEYGQAEAAMLGGIWEVLHRLAFRLDSWHHGERPLREWIQLHRELMDEFLAMPGDLDRNHGEKVRATLANLANLARPGREVINTLRMDWFTFLRFFQDQLDQVEDSLGTHSSRGITFSSLRPWRAVSYPVIILLDMNETGFPRTDPPQTFDMGSVAAFAGLSARPDSTVQDSYAWLETLWAARSKLWIFWEAMDPSSGKKKELSPLPGWIHSVLGESCPVCVVPVHSDGSADPSLPGKEFLAADTLRQEALEGKLRLPVADAGAVQSSGNDNAPRPGTSITRSIGLVELARAFTWPVRAFGRFRLGMRVQAEEDLRVLSEEDLAPAFFTAREWFREEADALLSRGAFLDGSADPARAAEFLSDRAVREHRMVSGSLDRVNRTDLARKLENLQKGTTILQDWLPEPGTGLPLQEIHGTPAGEAREVLEIAGLRGPEIWRVTHHGSLLWNFEGTPCYVTCTDSTIPKMDSKPGSKALKESNRKIAELLLPLVIAHGLGPHRNEAVRAVVVSPKQGKGPDAIRCMLPPWEPGETSLKELLEKHFGALMTHPVILYPGIMRDLLELPPPGNPDDGDSRREAWEDWRADVRDGEAEKDFSPGDHDSDRTDSPASCPWFPLVVPDFPDWDSGQGPAVASLLDGFWGPVTARIRKGIVTSGGADPVSQNEGDNQ